MLHSISRKQNHGAWGDAWVKLYTPVSPRKGFLFVLECTFFQHLVILVVSTYIFHRRGKGYWCTVLLLYNAVCFQLGTPTMISISSHLLFLFLDNWWPYQEVGGESITALSKQPKGHFRCWLWHSWFSRHPPYLSPVCWSYPHGKIAFQWVLLSLQKKRPPVST